MLLLWTLLAPVAPSSAAPRCGGVPGDADELAAAWLGLEANCGCAPGPAEAWKPGFKTFVSCTRSYALQAVLNESIRSKCRSRLIAGAKKSTCARPAEWMTCCFTNTKNKTSCKLKKAAEQCATTFTKFAEAGSTETCLDACDDAAGPLCWEDSECNDGDVCTTDWCEPSDGCHNVEIAGCVPAGGGGGGTSCTGTGDPTHGLSANELVLFQLLNDYRASNGKPPVTVCSSLSRASQDHANDMRGRRYFSHLGANGSEFWERTCDAGYTHGCGPITWMGEIIAGYDSTPAGAIGQWIGSPGHASIMADAAHVVVGIGHACGGQLSNYWVMDFAAANEPSCG